MSNDKPIARCELCGNEFQYGMHRYAGKWIKQYQLLVCEPCFDGNWDGWSPHHGPRLLAHLKAKGIPVPERNAKGWIPRGD